jgi:tetratricopeptide (TPR) repeat protein
MRRCILAAGWWLLLLISAPQALLAQGEADEKHEDQPRHRQIGSIHRLTESARTVNDYTAIIDRCNETIDQAELTAGDRDYLQKLASWAFNRRCESRMEAAEYFRDSGLADQATSAADEALADAIEALERDATRWRAWINRGVLFAQAGMLDAALADFRQVTELQPESALGWFNSAEALMGLARHTEAIAHCDRALQIDAGDLQSLTGRGLCRLQLGAADAALEDFALVAKMMPNNAAALVNRGDAQRALGQWRAAYEDYVAAAELSRDGPANDRAAWLLATCPEAEFFRPHTAKDLALQAISTHGPNRARLEALAAACAALGEFETAVEKQTAAIEMASADMQSACRERLELYRKRQPFKQTAALPVAASSQLP